MSVKLITVILALALIFTCFTTACQPVAGEPAAHPTAVTQAIPKLSDSYKVSEHWSETVENDKVRIIIDADVLVPNVTEYPVIRVEPAAFTQQRVDELVNYFANGNQLYLPHVMTKADYQKQLNEAKLGEKENGEYVITDWSLNEVKSLEKKLAAAPEDSPLIISDTTLTFDRDHVTGKETTAGGKNFLSVVFDNGEGGEASISIENFNWGYADYEIYRIYNNPTRFSYSSGIYGFGVTESMYYYETVYLGEPEEECGYAGVGELFDKVKIAPDEAIAQADKVINDLGISGLMLVSAEKYVTPGAPEKCGYELKYTRESGGIPLCRNGGGSRFSGEKAPEYSPPLTGEILYARVSEDGLQSFSWMGCANVVETVNENAELLPFESIRQTLIDRIIYEKSFLREGQLQDYTVIVTSAELRMGYIGADKPRQAIMVPVWVFNTEEKHTWQGETVMGNKETYVFSAIDGGAVEHRGGGSTYLIQ